MKTNLYSLQLYINQLDGSNIVHFTLNIQENRKEARLLKYI